MARAHFNTLRSAAAMERRMETHAKQVGMASPPGAPVRASNKASPQIFVIDVMRQIDIREIKKSQKSEVGPLSVKSKIQLSLKQPDIRNP